MGGSITSISHPHPVPFMDAVTHLSNRVFFSAKIELNPKWVSYYETGESTDFLSKTHSITFVYVILHFFFLESPNHESYRCTLLVLKHFHYSCPRRNFCRRKRRRVKQTLNHPIATHLLLSSLLLSFCYSFWRRIDTFFSRDWVLIETILLKCFGYRTGKNK